MNGFKRNSDSFSTLSGAMMRAVGQQGVSEVGDNKQGTADCSALVAADEVSVSQAFKEIVELFLRQVERDLRSNWFQELKTGKS